MRFFPFAAVIGGGGFTPSNAETTTWKNAVIGDGGSVTDARLQLVDGLITSLKSASIWTKFDRLWLFAAANSQSALRDIKAAALASVVNAPTLTADRGYAGNGTSSYVSSGFNPSTAGGVYVQDSAHVSIRSLTSQVAGDKRIIGRDTAASPSVLFSPRSAGDVFTVRLNDQTFSGLTNATTQGLFLINRGAAATRDLYVDGSSIGSQAVASTGVPNQVILYGADVGAPLFTDLQFASASIGGALTAPEVTSYKNAEATYMTAVGAI